MAHLEPLETLLLQYRKIGHDIFITENPDSVLVLRLNEPDDQEWSGFRTDTFAIDRDALKRGWSKEEQAAMLKAEGLSVLRIAKSPENPWRGRISLGRARNNDLPVVDSSVSKLHAHFTVEPGQPVQIIDAGSHNGTKLNGKKIKPSVPTPLKPNDQLRFGEIPAVFYEPESLANYLASLFTK